MTEAEIMPWAANCRAKERISKVGGALVAHAFDIGRQPENAWV